MGKEGGMQSLRKVQKIIQRGNCCSLQRPLGISNFTNPVYPKPSGKSSLVKQSNKRGGSLY